MVDNGQDHSPYSQLGTIPCRRKLQPTTYKMLQIEPLSVMLAATGTLSATVGLATGRMIPHMWRTY